MAPKHLLDASRHNVVVTLPVYSELGQSSSTTWENWRTGNVAMIQVLTALGKKKKQNRNAIFCNKCKGWDSLNRGWFVGLQTRWLLLNGSVLVWVICGYSWWVRLPGCLFSCSFDIQRATVDLPSVENGKLGCNFKRLKRRAFVLAAMSEAAFPV